MAQGIVRLIKGNEEARVISVVLGTLILLEFALSFSLSSLSIDHSHIMSMREVGDSMRLDSRPKILVLGNSQARRGIDKDILSRKLREEFGTEFAFYQFVPDGGTISDWRFGWDKFFSDGRLGNSSIVLICGGSGHLDDRAADPKQIGSNYVGAIDLLPVMFEEFSTTENRLQLVASWASLCYSNGFRVQRRLRETLFPRYRLAAQAINEQSKKTSRQRNGNETKEEGLEQLSRFVGARTNEGLRVVVINTPNFLPYSPPVDIDTIISDAGGSYFDFRYVKEIDDSCFIDPYGTDPFHLNDRGAAIFTSRLAQLLAVEQKANGRE